jgi:hypothetical protein
MPLFLLVVTCEPHSIALQAPLTSHFNTKFLLTVFFSGFFFFLFLLELANKIGIKYFHVKCVHETTRSIQND